MGKVGVVVLYVEDEEMDRFLMQRAFSKVGLGTALQTVNDGQAAIDYLSGKGPYKDREKHPLPGVLLLDLNLPEVPGFEVLKWVRMQPGHKALPVVIFSSSELPEDKLRARELGANEFLQKPASGLGFVNVAQKLEQRWADAHPNAGTT